MMPVLHRLVSGVLVCLCVSVFLPPFACADAVPVPEQLPALALAKSREAQLEALLGVPYRPDGAVDEEGRFTLFANRAKRFDTPGFNCSGLLLEACRFLFKRNISLDEASRDRLGDSGPGSARGQDWDFGWDIIVNVSEGLERRFILPGGAEMDPAQASGVEPLGWSLTDPSLWRELPLRLKKGHVYLVSMTMQARLEGYGLQHYHVGLVYVDGANKAWFYQTTGRGKVSNRRDLKSAQGQASFMQAFASGSPKKMLVLEVTLPD